MDQEEVINSINSDLIRGHIDTIILKALQAGDRYGYDIIKEIEHKSEGQYVIKQPTLYSCLKRLEVQGFVKSYWGSKSIGGRKKYFTLTDMGRELFIKNINDWNYSRDVINKLISDEDYSTYESEDEQNSGKGCAENQLENELLEENTTETVNLDNDSAQEIEDNNDIENEESCDNDDSIQILEESIVTDELEESCEDSVENADLTDDSAQENEELDVDDIVETESCEVDQEIDQHEEQEEDQADLHKDELLMSDEDDLLNDESIVDDAAEQIENSDIAEEAISETSENEMQPIAEIGASENKEIDLDSLPLSPAEQNHVFEETSFVEDEKADLVNHLYAEQNPESYISNVNSTEYEPSKSNVIDFSNYFADIAEDEYEDEDEVASSVAALPPADLEIQEEKIVEQPRNFGSSPRILREFPAENETVFFSYKRPMTEIDESSAVIDKGYRAVIAKLISDNIIDSKPPMPAPIAEKPEIKSPEQPIITPQAEKLTQVKKSANELTENGDKINIRDHNHSAIKIYNNKHYYYSNQLRLFQSGVLFATMLLELILCFYFIEIRHNELVVLRTNLILYVIAVVLSAAFPIVSFFMASADYYKRKRINYNGKSSIIFSIAATVLVMLIVFFVNVYGGILSGNIDNYLSSLIMPMLLSTNLIVNAVVFHLLYQSGRFSLEN